MDMSKVKLIFSEKYNQFYKPMRIDEDVGIIYMQVSKNRHDKGMKKDEIIHMEENIGYKYVIMHDSKTTAEQHFINVMNNKCNVHVKLGELKCFKKNMLTDSEKAMQILKKLSEDECDMTSKNYGELRRVHNEALKLYTKLNHRAIICDKRSTYINQTIPDDIKRLALSKRLFIERSDDYCRNGRYRHPSNKTDRSAIQAKYPCGFIVRDRGGVVVAGGRYEMPMEDAIEFVKNYIPTEREKHYRYSYQVPMSLKKKKQLKMCYKILQSHGLYYKNEHNYFFWVLDKNKNIVVGGKNGFGFRWLLKYCRKLKHKSLPKEK